ncbi:MAG: LptA/OstA family protein [Candidatus Firestonebacteria bacterium]
MVRTKLKNIALLAVAAAVALPIYSQEVNISKDDPLEIESSTWNVNNRTKAVTYTGEVKVRHAGNIMKAEKVTILPDSDMITAEKHIEFTEKSGTRTTGEFAEYLKSSKQLIMKENATLVSMDKEKVRTNVRADVMELYGNENRAVARGNVDISRLDMKVKCGTALLDDRKDSVVLEDNPVVTKLDDIFKGKKLTIYFGKRLLVAEGDVTAKFYVKGAGE